MLISLVWGALFYMAGMRVIWVMGLAGTAGVGLMAAFFTVPHVAQRINRFLNPASGDSLQYRYRDRIVPPWRLVRPRPGRRHHQAHPARWPYRFHLCGRGGGIRRRPLPHSGRAVRFHGDPRADQGDAHRRSVHPLCLRGFAILFGLQSTINMAVNLHLMPAKGMTLAVHLLWRLFADLARLRHGHAAGAHPRAAARQTCRRNRCSPRVRCDGRAGCRAGAGDGRRHRRPSVSRPKRWPRHWPSAASPSISRPTTAPRVSAALLPRTLSTSSPAQPCAARNPLALTRTAPCSAVGFMQAWRLIGRLKPAAVIGFGGYPTMPPVMAATLARRSRPSFTTPMP